MKDSFFSVSASSLSATHAELVTEQNRHDLHHFPPPPPEFEMNAVDHPPKNPSESHQMHTEVRPSVAARQFQLSSSKKSSTNGIHPSHGVLNGNIKTDRAAPYPGGLLPPSKTPPPLLAKPKL